MDFDERRAYNQKLKRSIVLFMVATLVLLCSHFVLQPKYEELKEDILSTSDLAKKITSVNTQSASYQEALDLSGKSYGNLVTEKDSYVTYLGNITIANNLNINKMTVGDITSAGSQLYAMKVEIELQGDLYNVKNLVQQLYDSEMVSRINRFSYRLQSDEDLQWMWRDIDDEQLVPWWTLQEEADQPAGPEETPPLGVEDLLAHGTALCFLEVEFLGTGG